MLQTPRTLLLAVLAVVAFGALPGAAQQRDLSQVEIKATPVAGKVHMLVGAGGNIGVSAGEDGILIVDDQYAPLSEKIQAALKGLGGGRLAFVLNTHWHGDHTGGNEAFGKTAPVIAHENVRKRLAAGQELRGEKVPPAPRGALPVITFDRSLSIHWNGEEIEAIHFPHGHTDGDTVVFFTGSNVVHMGDDFFAGRFPFVDLESGGSVPGLIENIRTVLARVPADVKVIPGHGPLSAKKDLETYLAMLEETTGLVRQRLAAGKTLEQAKAEGLPEKWREWGTGFVDTGFWIETIYKSLQAGNHR